MSRIAESAELEPTTVAKARAGVVQINVIAPRQQPNDALLRALECEINPDAGFVATDQFGQTSVSGVWAPGNVATPSAEVIPGTRRKCQRDRDQRLVAVRAVINRIVSSRSWRSSSLLLHNHDCRGMRFV